MKRAVLLLIIVLGAVAVTYFLMGRKDEKKRSEKPKPISAEANSEPFNQSFKLMLEAYYRVKDGLVKADTVAVNKAAAELAILADSLKVNEIKGDSTGMIKETAKSFTGTINGSSLGLAGEQNIEEKRKEFNMITDALLNLTRTVKYSGEKVYYQYCPMAFNNQGAYWLSNNSEILNPYFGSKMLHCGEVKDSIDY